jgi:hypothetical protein
MPPTGRKLNGKELLSQSREFVGNVYKYMKEAGLTITVKNIGVEVAKATNGCIGKKCQKNSKRKKILNLRLPVLFQNSI